MPTLSIRKANEVPAPNTASKAIQEKRRVYDAFINGIGSDVGELVLAPDESIRSVKMALTRSASRQGISVHTWDANGNVYFSTEPRRGRPRKG